MKKLQHRLRWVALWLLLAIGVSVLHPVLAVMPQGAGADSVLLCTSRGMVWVSASNGAASAVEVADASTGSPTGGAVQDAAGMHCLLCTGSAPVGCSVGGLRLGFACPGAPLLPCEPPADPGLPRSARVSLDAPVRAPPAWA